MESIWLWNREISKCRGDQAINNSFEVGEITEQRLPTTFQEERGERNIERVRCLRLFTFCRGNFGNCMEVCTRSFLCCKILKKSEVVLTVIQRRYVTTFGNSSNQSIQIYFHISFLHRCLKTSHGILIRTIKYNTLKLSTVLIIADSRWEKS